LHKIKYIILVIITFVSFSCSSKKDKVGNNKPNIIFLLTDDQRWDALGAMGNTIINTPHLDEMASNGLLFVFTI
jgi:hypothetical protein